MFNRRELSNKYLKNKLRAFLLDRVLKSVILLSWAVGAWALLTFGVSAQQEQQAILPENYHTAAPLLALGLLLLGMLLFGGLQVYKQVLGSSSIPQKALEQLCEERQRLLWELIRLDELFAQEKIAEQRYTEERQRYKQQLVALTRLCNLQS